MLTVAQRTQTFVSQTPNARQERSIYKLCIGKWLFEGKKKTKTGFHLTIYTHQHEFYMHNTQKELNAKLYYVCSSITLKRNQKLEHHPKYQKAMSLIPSQDLHGKQVIDVSLT